MPEDSWKLAPGLNNVGSFQSSGRPYASASCLAPISGANSLVIRFTDVSRWVTVTRRLAEDRSLRVAFSENGLHGGNYFRVHQSSSLGRLELKTSELWFMSEDAATYTFDIIAGLTNIPAGRTDTADGPNWSGRTGVG